MSGKFYLQQPEKSELESKIQLKVLTDGFFLDELAAMTFLHVFT